MKILSMVDAISGGGARVMALIGKGLPQHQHLIVTPGVAPVRPIGLPQMLRDAKIPVFYASSQARHKKGAMRVIEKKVMEFDPDIIINHWWKSSAITRLNKYGKTRKVYGRAKTVCVLHNNDVAPPGYDFYVAVSKHNSKFAAYANKQRKGKNSNLQVIYNGINIKRFDVPKKNVDKGKFVIGRVSSLARFKFPHNWIDFVNSFDIPNMKHIIVGDGPRYREFQQDTNRLKAKDRFELLGEIPNMSDMLPKTMARFDILCYMSQKDEAFSLAILEAMASGIPIVSENRGGTKEQIIHGKTGFLCNNKVEVKKYCEMLSRNPNMVERMGKAAKERAKKFTVEKMCKQYNDLFERLVGEKGWKRM